MVPPAQIQKTLGFVPQFFLAILVVACGPGYFVKFLADQGYKNVLGIDSEAVVAVDATRVPVCAVCTASAAGAPDMVMRQLGWLPSARSALAASANDSNVPV